MEIKAGQESGIKLKGQENGIHCDAFFCRRSTQNVSFFCFHYDTGHAEENPDICDDRSEDRDDSIMFLFHILLCLPLIPHAKRRE